MNVNKNPKCQVKCQVKVWMESVSPMNVLSLFSKRVGGGDKWVYSKSKAHIWKVLPPHA